MKKYIVTGGQGFIGGKIREKTGALSYDLKSGLDILNTESLAPHLESVDGIFHCAARISVPESIEKPEEYYRTNVVGTDNVIGAALKKKIVFSSSAAVYGESSHAVKEDETLNPKSPYAENKRDGEVLLEKTGVPHVALRYFNVYGPGQSPEYAGVITAFIRRALAHEDIVIFGDGNQVRDFIFVDDVAEANIKAMEYQGEKFEVFNIATGTQTSINDLARTIINLTGSRSKIHYDSPRPGDIVYSQADVSKAKNILGWQAKVSLEEGLKKTIAYYSA